MGLIQHGMQSVVKPTMIIFAGLSWPTLSSSLPYFSLIHEAKAEQEISLYMCCRIAVTDGDSGKAESHYCTERQCILQ